MSPPHAKPGASDYLIAFGMVSILFLLPVFLRFLRPAGPALALSLTGRYFSQVFAIPRSLILMSLFGVFAALAIGLWIQAGFGRVESLLLAARQMFYYVHAIIGALCCMVLVGRYRRAAFSARIILAAMVLYAILTRFGDAQFAGGFDIRGNFEAGTVFFVVALLFRTHRNAPAFIAVMLAYGVFSLATKSSQGAMLALLTMTLYASPAQVRAAACLIAAAAPLLFPFLLYYTSGLVSQIDDNVEIRNQLWSSLLAMLSNEGKGIGFGVPVYEAAMRYSGLDYIHFEDIENIGMHNAAIQLAAFIGIPGLVVAISFITCCAIVAIRNADDIRIVACYMMLIISLTLNQAFTHLIVLGGTELLLGVLIWAELRASAPRGRSRSDQRDIWGLAA